MAEVDFWLSGELRIRRAGVVETLGPTLLNEVLALLLLRANSAVPITEILSNVWPMSRRASETTIRPYISRIRSLLAGTGCVIERLPRRYLLRIDPMRVDVLRFAILAEQADTGDSPRRRALTDEAMRACPSDALLNDFTSGWVRRAREEHRAKWRIVAHRRNQLWLDAGEHHELLGVLRRQKADQSNDQRLAEHYLLALYRSGYVAEALAQVGLLVARLEEAGVPVSARLRSLGEQIGRQDHALDAPARSVVGAATVPDMLPPLTGQLAGRQADLRAIERHCATRDTVRVVGIYGAPGIGKSTLATAFAHRARDRYPGGVLYAQLGRARGPGPEVHAVLESFLRALGVSGDNIPAEYGERLSRYQSLVRQRVTLVVLDDVGATEEVVPLLPIAPGSVALVTSRTRLSALTSRYSALAVVLGPVDRASSIALLSRLAGHRPDWSPATAAEIAHACGGHPLALCLAGARLAIKPEETLASLSKALSEPGQRIPALDEHAESNEGVVDVIGWSYRGLDAIQARAFRRLSLAICGPPDLSTAAALIGVPPAEAHRILADLVAVHLVELVAQRYVMLDLVAEYAVAVGLQQDPDDDRSATVDRLYVHYRDAARGAAHVLWPLEVEPGQSPDLAADAAAARSWLDAHRDELVTAAGHVAAVERPRDVIDLAASLFRYLDHGGYLDQAVALQRAAVDAAASLGEPGVAARSLARLGAVLIRRGQLAWATTVLTESHDLYVQANDTDGRATVLGNLGRLAARRGALDDAVRHQQAALDLFRASGQRLAEARTLTNLAIVRRTQGELDEALRCLDLARAICAELGARDAAARAIGTAGGVLRAQGQLDEATRQYEEALTIFRELGDRVGEATIISFLGLVYSDQGRHGQAVACHEESLRIFSEIGDESGYIDALLHLGAALLAQGRVHAAVRSHTEALERAIGTGDENQRARAHAGLAEDYARWAQEADAPAGTVESARRELREALNRYRATGSEPPAAVLRLTRILPAE